MDETTSRIDPDRARGALIGLAVGDALGTTLEFSTPAPAPFPRLVDAPHREITGGGPFGLAPGQVTDDTQMAVCLAESLAARGGLDPADVARRYEAWSRVAFDAGAQTRAALAEIAKGTPPADAGRRVWEAAPDRRPAGNGSLMRTAPIAVRFALDRRARIAAALQDSAITHYDPRCQLACAAFDGAVAAAVTRPVAEPLELVEQAIAELTHAAPVLGASPGISPVARRDAVDALVEDLNLALEPDPRLHGGPVDLHQSQGFVRVAFRLAFWELLHAPSFEAALVDVVNRGGDADTNGAIAGALLGAFWGERSIPRRWRDAVLGALPGDAGPWGDTYHPRRLLGLVAGAAGAQIDERR